MADLLHCISRSQWPRRLRRRSSAAGLLRLWVRIPPGAWIFVCCECCMLSGRGLCDGLITRPEESYRLWRVVVCDQETSRNEEAKARYRAVKIQQQQHCIVLTALKKTNVHISELRTEPVRGVPYIYLGTMCCCFYCLRFSSDDHLKIIRNTKVSTSK